MFKDSNLLAKKVNKKELYNSYEYFYARLEKSPAPPPALMAVITSTCEQTLPAECFDCFL